MSTQGEFFEVPAAINAGPRADGEDAESLVGDVSEEHDVTGESATEADPAGSSISSHRPETIPFTSTSNRRGLKDLSIPKLYYSISEVSRITGLEQYVLRYWETEFADLRPQKNRAGNRIYSNKDIKFILKIKELLREKRYTIEGAKQILKEETASDREQEKLEADSSATPVSIAATEDPSQITIDEASKKPSIKIERAAIDEMRASVKTLKEMLRRK